MNRRSEIEMSGDRIMKNVKGIAGGAEELLRATAHMSGEGLAAARAKVEEQLEELHDMLGDAQDYAVKQARRAAATTDRHVHHNPWQAIGVAMAAGVLLGYLSRRR